MGLQNLISSALSGFPDQGAQAPLSPRRLSDLIALLRRIAANCIRISTAWSCPRDGLRIPQRMQLVSNQRPREHVISKVRRMLEASQGAGLYKNTDERCKLAVWRICFAILVILRHTARITWRMCTTEYISTACWVDIGISISKPKILVLKSARQPEYDDCRLSVGCLRRLLSKQPPAGTM